MGERTEEAARFFKAMGDVVSDNRRQLTDNQGIKGTDLGLIELMMLKSSYNQFEASCVSQLAAGASCTTVFNTTGGKRLDVEVSMKNGVDIKITSPGPEANNTRKVSFRPPAGG